MTTGATGAENGMAITLEATVVRSPAALSADLGEETVVLSVEAERYFGMDAIAADIWTRIAAPCRVADLCAALAAAYDAPPATIQADVLTLLESLVQYRMVTVTHDP